MRILLFANLAESAGTRSIDITVDEDATVNTVFEKLFEETPDLRKEIYTESGELADHVNILVDGDNVRHDSAGLERTVNGAAEIAIFPPVSGG